MNKKISKNKNHYSVIFLLLSICCFTGVILTSFKTKTVVTSQVPNKIKVKLLEDVDLLHQSVKLLTQSLQLYKEQKISPEQIQEVFYNVKRRYKEVEYLIEYLDPELAKSINGAPIPKVVVEQAAYQTLQFQKPTVRTFPPEGLQVLEELLFTEEGNEDTASKALSLSYTLDEKVALFLNSIRKQNLTEKQVLGSLREELIRVMTMGITGFDAPAAGKETEHAALSLKPVLFATRLYTKTTTGKAGAYAAKATQQIEQAIHYLEQHSDFDSFDRLYFIKEIADPAYSSLTSLQKILVKETNTIASKAVDDQAESIFSTNFLQAGFYAKQDQRKPKAELIELGKVLFFDPVLSSNNQRSCASCHIPSLAFTDGKARSTAFDFKGTVQRNAPSLVNSVFSTIYFWDSRSTYIQDQVPVVLTNKAEMHSSYEEVSPKLQQSPEYKRLFKKAFNKSSGEDINPNTINRAIAAYVSSLVALNSPFDRFMRHETELLDESAKRGFNLFMGKAACGTCHFAPTFNGTVPPRFLESESEVLGVPAHADLSKAVLDPDLGKGNFIPAKVLQHSFKTPTVRNAALTGPYMHNGVFNTLDEVINFYDLGGGAGLGLDVPNQTLPDAPLNLTKEEKKDLVAFMNSLTDTSYNSTVPKKLPRLSAKSALNNRPVGGNY